MAALPEPQETAKSAGLVYVTDELPGISRRKHGRGFSYFDKNGKRIGSKARKKWLKSLAVPPAWTEVWISPVDNGHILATGRDERGRKQYIYHPVWHEQREYANYSRLLPFGQALKGLREAVDADLRRHSLSYERVCALVIRLMEETLARVGNPEYAATNQTYGLTTLTDEHLEMHGSRLEFEFTGKSGKTFHAKITDRRAARVLSALQELPGQHLFQYVDQDSGQPAALRSDDINEYLRKHTGGDFSAKDLRTWGGSCLTLRALVEHGPEDSETARKRAVVAAIKTAAERLNNTLAVCRRHYVHPVVPDSYSDGTLFKQVKPQAESFDEEALLLKLLKTQT